MNTLDGEEDDMNPGTEIYEDLLKHLDGQSADIKAKKSGVKMSILKHLYTQEEAKIAMQLSTKPETLKQIYNRIDGSEITKQELKEVLEQMVYNGTVFTKREGYDEIQYSGAGFFFSGMYTFQADRLTEDLAKDFHQYSYDTYTAKEETELKKRILEFRAVPVEEAISVSEKKAGSAITTM